ncbi:MAG TPA: 3'-5' exonuclease, partial [Candidatus Nitrosocosmicus sp.]|nr:3'-5' exonuclease [Candidatus Nitrosocosmicus sp.]
QEIKRLVNQYDYSDVAVLYRINAQSRTIEEALLNYSIPYTLVGGTRFYERKEIKDILSYVRLIVNPLDEISLKRVIKLGKQRYEKFKNAYKEIKDRRDELTTSEIIDEILQKTKYIDLYDEQDPDDLARLENIKELRSVAINFPTVNEFLEQVALVESEYSENEKMKKGQKGVTLMTLHQAKGLEFPFVFLVGVEDGILPHARSVDDLYQLEEERRLFYVGITRAREKLYLTHTRKRFMFGRRIYAQVSRFISTNEPEEYDYTKTW